MTSTATANSNTRVAAASAPHPQHPMQHPDTDDDHDDINEVNSEASPLVGGNPKSVSPNWVNSYHGHLSMMEGNNNNNNNGSPKNRKSRVIYHGLLILVCISASAYLYKGMKENRSGGRIRNNSNNRHNHNNHDNNNNHNNHNIVLVEDAEEHWLDVGDGLQIWYRTWGRTDGIPILFVHGGPGNSISDYFDNGNQRFFADANNTFFVVEVDQRGTGNSQPSVRDDWRNMEHYKDISIDKMCGDFEDVRKHLGLQKWLVWGGSFGSTLSINYGERYPESCLALIIRGIYLDTPEEVAAVYSRQVYLDNPKRLHEFDILYDYAARHVVKEQTNNNINNNNNNNTDDSLLQLQSPPLDPNDSEALLRVYADMIVNGDKHAIWHWFVFENNLMEIDPKNILDPNHIENKFYRESLSVAFFETHLWLHGSFDTPTSDLMNPNKIANLTMPLWVCQGQRDEVCPPKYARKFVNAVEAGKKSPRVVSRIINGTHEDTDPAIEQCLQWSLKEFAESQRNPL